MDVLTNLDTYILVLIWLAAMPVGLFAFIHALLQRADAFTAVGKLSKPAWLGITGGASVVLLFFSPGSGGMILWLAALIAVLVYIVDVRPKVTEIQQGPRW